MRGGRFVVAGACPGGLDQSTGNRSRAGNTRPSVVQTTDGAMAHARNSRPRASGWNSPPPVHASGMDGRRGRDV